MAVPESGNIAVLAEKPSVARDIARVLGATSRGDGYLHGNGYVVTWALGHLAALAQPHEEIKLLSSKCVEVGTFAVQDRMKKATGQTLRVASRLVVDGKADEAIDVLEWNLKQLAAGDAIEDIISLSLHAAVISEGGLHDERRARRI